MMFRELSPDIFKRPNSKSDYSNRDLEDLAGCIDDPLFFMRSFVRVQHPMKGAVPFIPYECQERIITGIHQHRFTIILCARQQGKTVSAAAYLLWRTMFVPDTIVLITANKYLQALEIMTRIRFAYEHLPDHIRAGANEYNKGSISFDNGSRIIARATSEDAGRGISATLLYCLSGETIVRIRNKMTGMIEQISLETLHDRLGQAMTNINEHYEIWSPTGWCDFVGVMKKGVQPLWEIVLSDNCIVTATKDHVLFANGKRIALRDLARGDLLDTETGSVSIVEIRQVDADVVFDVVEVENEYHAFYINNGIVSKNCDEMAFVPPGKQKEFWTSIQPIISTGGSCIITSTPKNDEDQFAQIWKGANTPDEFGNMFAGGVGRNGFFPVLSPWWEHPERDEKWAKPFRESLGEARFRQEFCGEFLTDDDSLINPFTLLRLQVKNPAFYTGTIRWYVEPEPNKTYLVALDPALGTKNDYSTVEIFQLPEMIQVAEWQNNDSAPRRQVAVLMEAMYALDGFLRDNPLQSGDPEIFWTFENNSIGEAVLTIVEDTGEERFPGSLVTERRRKGLNMKRVRKGLNTTTKSRLSSLARLKSLIESGRMTIHSQNLIRELKNFVAVGNSYKAKPGEHDDLVMATSLIVRMIDIVLSWSLNSENRQLREYIDDSELADLVEEPLPVLIG